MGPDSPGVEVSLHGVGGLVLPKETLQEIALSTVETS